MGRRTFLLGGKICDEEQRVLERIFTKPNHEECAPAA